jgi:hypothetical protein
MGPRYGPQPPKRSSPPGKAGALLDLALLAEPDIAPKITPPYGDLVERVRM